MPETVPERALRQATGLLAVDDPNLHPQLRTLYTSLSQSLLTEDLSGVGDPSSPLQNSEHLSAQELSPALAAELERIAQTRSNVSDTPKFRVVTRANPSPTSASFSALPAWAAGAAVDHTIGPFPTVDGRQVWYDFFRIEQLVALYGQDRSDPVLLFKVSLRMHILDVLLAPVTEAAASYTLPAGSIWIATQLFAPSAPAGRYTGLTIAGGSITLSAHTSVVGGKLTASSGTRITVRLDLRQPAPVEDPASPYGADARAATLHPPAHITFHLTASSTGWAAAVESLAAANWNLYGNDAQFTWEPSGTPTYDPSIGRVLFPLLCSSANFSPRQGLSPLFTLSGEAPLTSSSWAIPSSALDILHPTAAAGDGGILVRCGAGLTGARSGLSVGDLSLHAPTIVLDPGAITLIDAAATGALSRQTLRLWEDRKNPFGTDVEFGVSSANPFSFESLASGTEVLLVTVDANLRIDRPVTSTGSAIPVHSSSATLVIAVSKALRLLALFDSQLSAHTVPPPTPGKPISFRPLGIALHNALFKVTPVEAFLMYGLLSEDLLTLTSGAITLRFGVLAYLPALPDPYAANLHGLEFQFRGDQFRTDSGRQVWMALLCLIQWKPDVVPADEVTVAFFLAPPPPLTGQIAKVKGTTPTLQQVLLSSPNETLKTSSTSTAQTLNEPTFRSKTFASRSEGGQNYGPTWDRQLTPFQQDTFALLDVSSNADLLGVSFGLASSRLNASRATQLPTSSPGNVALQVKGMDVVSSGENVHLFTVPQVSWEPVINLTPPAIPGDPPFGPNYYADDGDATRVLNNSVRTVALAPVRLTEFITRGLDGSPKFHATALFTLPFGMKSIASLEQQYGSTAGTRPGTSVNSDLVSFPDEVTSALHLELNAGAPLVEGESVMFIGATVQTSNILDSNGAPTGANTLGSSVAAIFNDEFFLQPDFPFLQRGVPLTRIDLTGYGANCFSNWANPKASIAATSQAKFTIWNGRCAHEVIQVKTILHPYGHQVVRTITLFRTSSGYTYRYDSGWIPLTSGQFDFTYYINKKDSGTGQLKPDPRSSPYEIHPGLIDGLFNTREIKETTDVLPFITQMRIGPGQIQVDEFGQEQPNPGPGDILIPVELQPVFFNADVAVQNPVSGFRTTTIDGVERKVVASKGILGFVQIAPRGIPISSDVLRELMTRQGTIGGPLDTTLDLGASGQQMRTRGFDISNSFGADGSSIIFAGAVRGTPILPKDGAWSLVQHLASTGDVTPVPESLSVPAVRIGKVTRTGDALSIQPDPTTQLVRVAEAAELLRAPVASTVNYGFLHSTDTQKALFLTPAYARNVPKLFSKTPPLFADAFRICNSKGIFPNIGDAIGNFGDAINLGTNGTEFTASSLTDAGSVTREIMRIDGVADGAQRGFKLLKQVASFDLPSTAWTLAEVSGVFKIYIEYKADNVTRSKANGGGTKNLGGALDYDIDSLASTLDATWKSHMQNVALVVDLGPINRLLTIKGNWDANKGAEAQYGGNESDSDFPSPQLEFSPVLQPIIDILQILEDLQGENYKDAFSHGLKLAMSNKAGSWEYKLEASKEIPVVRFPPGFEYDDPNAPFKLEAGLKLGAYFNAALKVTTDPKQLLPTAGGYVGFYGKLSVMCVSVSIGTIYAVGQVNLDIGADTAKGKNLHMKFGFGAQIVVGLPVVGSVSVLYMVGAEIFLDSTTLSISAFMLFQGNADLLGGMVNVTITIEAKGTITRTDSRTDLAAQVSFGLDISIFLVIDISFSTSWQEQRQIA